MRDLLTAGSPLLKDLITPEVNAKLRSLATQKHYGHKQLIHARGDLHQGLSIVVSGSVRAGNVGHDGSYIATSFFDAGHCFGEFTLFAGLPRTHDTTAVGETVIEEIAKPKFLKLFNSEPMIAQALLTIALMRSHRLLEFMDDFRRLPLATRVAKAIFRASEKTKELEIRQEELAFTYGVSRVSMGKALKKLEKLELIELGYGRIRVPCEKALEKWLQKRILVLPLESR